MFTVYTIKTFVSERGEHICWLAPDPAAPLHRLLLANWKSNLFATIYQHNKHLEKQSVWHLCLLRNLPAEISLAVFLKTVYKTDYKKCISWLQYSDDGSLDRVGVISHMRNPLWKTILAEWWIAHSSTPWIQTFLVPKPWWVHIKFPELHWFMLHTWFNRSNVNWTITTCIFLHLTLHLDHKTSRVPVLQLN